MPEEYGLIRTWLIQHKITAFREPSASPAPLAVREADFLRFIEYPYFLKGFRRFWHQAPKNRHNKETRVLLCIAAALSQMVACDQREPLEIWSQRLARMASYSEQTQQDITDLCLEMQDESYEAQELFYRIFVDANKVDRQNLISFCQRYSEKLGGFASEFLRGMQISD